MTEQEHRGAAWSTGDLAGNPHEVADKADRVERMFASIAHRYDLNNRLHSLWRDQAWRRAAVALADVRTEDDVLDMACGTGDLAVKLAEAGAQTVVGMDFTEAMLGIARRKHAGCPNLSYQWGDAMSIDLPDGSVDLVTIAFGLRNVAQPSRALAEFRRVLRAGGRLIVLEFSEPSNPILRVCNAWYTRHFMPLTAGLIAGDRAGAYRYLPRSVQTFAGPEDLAQQVEEAGFTVTAQRPQTFGICTITRADVNPQSGNA